MGDEIQEEIQKKILDILIRRPGRIWGKLKTQLFFNFYFLKILFIYSAEIETASERGNTSRGSGRVRSRLIAAENDVALDTTTTGSRPEPKADA